MAWQVGGGEGGKPRPYKFSFIIFGFILLLFFIFGRNKSPTTTSRSATRRGQVKYRGSRIFCVCHFSITDGRGQIT